MASCVRGGRSSEAFATAADPAASPGGHVNTAGMCDHACPAALLSLLAVPRTLHCWLLQAAARPLIVPALVADACARRRLAVAAWEAYG